MEFFLLFSGFILLDLFVINIIIFTCLLLSKVWQAKRKCFSAFLHTFCPFWFCVLSKKTKTTPKTNDRAGFCHFVLRKKKKVGGFLIMALRRYIVEVARMLDLFLCLLFAFSLLAAMDRLFVVPPPPPPPPMSCTDSGSRSPKQTPCSPSQMAVGRCNCMFIQPLRYDAEVKSWMEEPCERKAFPSLWERTKQHRVRWRCECHVGLSSTLALALIWDYIYIYNYIYIYMHV